MNVKGKTRGDINVRLTPVVISGNIYFVSRGIVEFTGELITSAIDNKQWIKLHTWNRVDMQGSYATYIASWVVDYSEIQDNSPTLTHTIQVYSDGSLVIDGIPY